MKNKLFRKNIVINGISLYIIVYMLFGFEFIAIISSIDSQNSPDYGLLKLLKIASGIAFLINIVLLIFFINLTKKHEYLEDENEINKFKNISNNFFCFSILLIVILILIAAFV